MDFRPESRPVVVPAGIRAIDMITRDDNAGWKEMVVRGEIEPNFIEQGNRRSFAHYCAMFNRPKMLEGFLELVDSKPGFDPNLKDLKGMAAVHYAAASGHTEILKIFSNYGFNLMLKTASGETPLSLASKSTRTDTVTFLNQWTPNPQNSLDSAANRALRKNDLDEIEKIIKEKPESFDGQAWLFGSVRKNNIPLFNLLSKVERFSIMAVDNDDCTLLHRAAGAGLDMFLIVEQAGQGRFDLSAASKINGMTCAHFAALGNQEDVLRYLASKGANLGLSNINRETPLMLAQQKNFDKCAAFLREWASQPTAFIAVPWIEELVKKYKLTNVSVLDCSQVIRYNKISQDRFFSLTENRCLALAGPLEPKLQLIEILEKERGSFNESDKLKSEISHLKNQLELQAGELMQKDAEILRLKKLLGQ